MASSRIHFPWTGFVLAIAGSALLFLTSHQDHLARLGLPDTLMQEQYQLAILAIVILSLLLELTLFHHNRQRFDKKVKNYEDQLAELLKGKNALQNKARKYADHADKLKLFISDRLLEYIEYDEKFLHFKNIAAEVRHNGIISYDKVHTALQKALNKTEGNETESRDTREALRYMRYLWDLLDLATTDNMAMYIANKIYEAEEQYYHQALHKDDAANPYSPTYDLREAILVALRVFIQDAENPLPPVRSGTPLYQYNNKQFAVELADISPLLGNENYIVLLMENIINNALYYASNPKSASQHAKIAVRLDQAGAYARVRVYNAGPQIEEEHRDAIFKLGYSTRRSKGHHGKGLGLYFASEIVKGNEGKIGYENTPNTPDSYFLRIELEHGSLLNETVHTELDRERRLYCTTENNSDKQREIDFESEQAVSSIEITVQSTGQTHRYADLGEAAHRKLVFIDPKDAARPRWSIEVNLIGRRYAITFKPLDISGVEFTVQIPTAASRLDADFHELENDELGQVKMDPDVIRPYIR